MKMVKAMIKTSLSVSMLSILIVSASMAKDLGPGQYIDLEITVRSITLEEVRGRATGNEVATDAEYKQQIKEKYQQYGVSAGSHLKYGNTHSKEITRWLQDHPEKQVELDNLANEFNQLIQIAN